MPVALSNGEMILVVFFAAVPVALLLFVLGAGKALRQIGKGQFAVSFEDDAPRGMRDSGSEPGGEMREDEIRQLLEAKAYRQRSRGEEPLDVSGELDRLLAERPAPARGDAGLREEVRQLVIARNERRVRQGKDPLDVEAETERRLGELEGLDGR